MAREFTPEGKPVFKPTFIAKQLARIAIRDEPDGVWRCRYCRREVRRTDVDSHWSGGDLPWPERDHVIPLNRGGTNAFENLALACARCNQSKGDLLLSELPAGWPSVPAKRIKRENVGGHIEYSEVPAGHATASRVLIPTDPSTWSDLAPCAAAHQLLYRFLDGAGGLLYVGVTTNPKERWKYHRKTKTWWSQVVEVAVECHESEDIAHAAEYRAITTETPRHNRHGARRAVNR